jgi:hypothetical protein
VQKRLLLRSYKRVIDLDSGTALVTTDLHGAGAIYDHLRKTFLRLRAEGTVNRWIICGDLIHSSGPEQDDASLRMILDVMRLQEELGQDQVILLLGNHEMPHIYGITLSKGSLTFTPRFEQALAALDHQSKPKLPYHRRDVMAFLRRLPFYVRTKAGVTLSHAGAALPLATGHLIEAILDFDHDALLKLADDRMRAKYDVHALKSNARYIAQAQAELAIEGPYDPRLPELARAIVVSQTCEDFHLLWDVLFAQNETGGTPLSSYKKVVQESLQQFSACGPYEQRVIVAGHIGVEGGHKLVGLQQLRLASYAHAHPNEAGEVLLLNCEQPILYAEELLPHLRPTLS